MTKISIARRRLENMGPNSFTRAEWSAKARELDPKPVVRPEPSIPVTAREKVTGPGEGTISFPYAIKRRGLLEGFLNRPDVKEHPLEATFEKDEVNFILKLSVAGPGSKKFVSAKEVSDLLAVSRDTVYRYVKSGELKGYRFGRSLRFDFQDVMEFLSARQVGRRD